MKHLGIDYGSKRIGIAVSNDDGTMAFPFLVIENDKKIIEKVSQIIKEEEIKKVIIGESKNYKMIDNEIMTEIMDFKNIIEKEIEIDVCMHSELLSSSMAEQIQGKNKMLDASAATIILQSYLDLENYKNNK